MRFERAWKMDKIWVLFIDGVEESWAEIFVRCRDLDLAYDKQLKVITLMSESRVKVELIRIYLFIRSLFKGGGDYAE